jgi:hypothetical protein
MIKPGQECLANRWRAKSRRASFRSQSDPVIMVRPYSFPADPVSGVMPMGTMVRKRFGAVQHIAPLVGLLFFASSALAETPCDFKGISVGDKMSPAELMSALGVPNYKTNPARPSFEHTKALVERYSMLAAAEIEDDEIGPYCDDTSCRIPYGIFVGNMNAIPVKAFFSFHDGLITEISVKFGELYWDQVLPIIDQKYGDNWKVEREGYACDEFREQEKPKDALNLPRAHPQRHKSKHKRPLQNLGS